MTIAPLGELTVGGAVPGAASAVVAGEAGITVAVPDLQARIDAIIAWTPVEVSFAADLALAIQTVAGIQAAITAGLTPPSIAAQIAIMATTLAELEAQLAQVNAQLAIIVALKAPLLVAGLRGYAFDGDASAAGSEIGGALSGDFTGHINAVVFATSAADAWAALGEIVKVTP
jgi:hypothetical protein